MWNLIKCLPNLSDQGCNTKAGPFGHLESKLQIHDPTHQTRLLGNLGKLLVGIKPGMSRSTTRPSLQPLGCTLTGILLT